jgi:hypothetical protein
MGLKRQKYFPLTASYFGIWTQKLQPERSMNSMFGFTFSWQITCQARYIIKPPQINSLFIQKKCHPFHKTPKHVNKEEPKDFQLTLTLVRCGGTKETNKPKGMKSTHTENWNCPHFKKGYKTQPTPTKKEEHINKSKNHSLIRMRRWIQKTNHLLIRIAV